MPSLPNLPQPDRPRNDAPSFTSLLLSRRIAWPAAKVSIVVGSVLNLVNNGPLLWSHQPVGLWQLAMNYLIPFCVSSYSAARNEAQQHKG